MAERIIFHVDVNSAFLSWSAAYRVRVLGEQTDLRNIPSVVAGDRTSRHSIVLAKSTPAKRFGIQTGEPLFKALEKCPDLVVVAPDQAIYSEASQHFVAMLQTFSPVVEQFSIDEAWVDMTGTQRLWGPPRIAAEKMRQRIWDELGFTVNIGISNNKLLAKMAGDLEKPNKIITLFPDELEQKLWPLPVRELFSVGASAERKLKLLGIYTIGDLAHADVATLRRCMGKFGESLWHSANGRNTDAVITERAENKGYSNSMTVAQDVVTSEAAHQVLLQLCENVAARLRRDGNNGSCITVQIRTKAFRNFSHQSKLSNATNITREIYQESCRIFEEMWDHETPLRLLGVQVTQLTKESYHQLDLFHETDPNQYAKKIRLDETVDALRDKYGNRVIQRARFTCGPVKKKEETDL